MNNVNENNVNKNDCHEYQDQCLNHCPWCGRFGFELVTDYRQQTTRLKRGITEQVWSCPSCGYNETVVIA